MQLTFVPYTIIQYMLCYIYVHIKIKPEPIYRCSTMYTQHIHSYSSITKYMMGLAKTNCLSQHTAIVICTVIRCMLGFLYIYVDIETFSIDGVPVSYSLEYML